MNWIQVATTRFELFILVFARVFTIFSTVPIFGTSQIPTQAKIAFSYFVVLILFPVIPLPKELPSSLILYFFMLGKEILFGLIIGYVSFILFSGIQIGGQIIDLLIGFGLANVINPISNIQVSIMGNFQYIIALLVFVSMNGHFYLLLALSQSFHIVPVGTMQLSAKAFLTFDSFLSKMFVIAFELAFPSVAALFITNIALGVISRFVPQLNVFFVGFAITIFVGFLVTIITLNGLMAFHARVFHDIFSEMMAMMRVLR